MDPIDFTVGTRIRGRRVALKMSQEALAAAIGVTFQQLQKYEGAANRVSASRLYQIAQTLKVEPSYFFEASRTGKRAAETEMDRLTALIQSDEGQALNKAFQRITNRSLRKSIVALVANIATEQSEPKKTVRKRSRVPTA